MKVLRSIVAVLAGIVIAGVVALALEKAGHMLYPPPPEFDNPGNMEAMRAAMSKLQMGNFVCVLLAWAVSTFAGGWAAAFIARRAQALHALIVGGIMMAGAIATMVMLPHPVWFWIAGLLLFAPCALLGARLVNRPPTAQAPNS